MQIGIIGAGRVGGNLAKGLAARGHTIRLGVRNPGSEKTKDLLAALGDAASAGLPEGTAQGMDAVILAVPWPAAETVLASGPDWDGVVLIDTTNRIGALSSSSSAAEDVARLAPGARVVKAFNIIGAEHFTNPDFDGEPASMLICGDDGAAKSVAARLAADLGFEVVDAGPLRNAGLLESLAALWVSLARGPLGRNIAFRLLRRP